MDSITLGRLELIAAIEARAAEHRAADDKAAKAFKRAQHDYCVAIRDAARAAAKLTDAEILRESHYDFTRRFLRNIDRPACPMSMVSAAERQLRMLRVDRRRRVTVKGGDIIGRLLGFTVDRKTICDGAS